MSTTNGSYPAAPIGRVKPWPGNPRKTFPEAELAELAASLAVQGVLVPLLVRPYKGRADTYEIADGERRYRAAQIAGLTELPIKVMELTDLEMLEIALSSLQREDVAPLEVAAAYRDLLNQGRTVEQIAEQIGKSVSTVRDLLQLLDLPDAARDALIAGRLPKETAKLIGRVPGAAAREQLTRMVLCNVTWEPTEYEAARAKDGEPMSSRAAKQLIQSRFMVQLKGSPFDQRDASLPGGSCQACPKRAGNIAELKADGVRADVCTDPACHAEKLKAWQARVLAAAEATGQLVLQGPAAKKLFPFGTELTDAAPYFDLAAQCDQDVKKNHRSYKQLLEGKIEDADVVLCPDGRGVFHRLVPKELALPILRKEHGLFKLLQSAGAKAELRTTDEERKARAKRLLEGKIERATRRAVLARAAAAAEELFVGLAGLDTAGQVLRVLAQDALQAAYPTVIEDVAQRREIAGKSTHEQREGLKDVVAAADGPALLGLLTELSVGRNSGGPFAGDGAKVLAKALGLDRKGLEKEVRARLKEEHAAKKAGKGKTAPPPPDGTNPVTRADPLERLLPAALFRPAAAALAAAGLVTLGDLLGQAAGVKASSPASRVYSVLRSVANLGPDANKIGDALVDAGVLGMGAVEVQAPALPPPEVPDMSALYSTAGLSWLRKRAARGDQKAKAELERRGEPLKGQPGRPKKAVPS